MGHTILSVGLTMVLVPALTNLAAAAVLGAVVGALKVFNRNRPVLAVPLPVVAATLVAALVFLAVRWGLWWTRCTRSCRRWSRSCLAPCSRSAWWSWRTATW